MAASWRILAWVPCAFFGGCNRQATIAGSAVVAMGSVNLIDSIVGDALINVALPVVRAQNAAATTDANVGADSITSTATVAIASTLASSGFARGDGSANSPLLVEQFSVTPEITLSYFNTGDGPANGFSTTAAVLPAGWSLAVHGCDGGTLENATTCSDTYALDTSASGRADFDVGNSITASWSSQDRVINDQVIAGVTTIFAAVISVASISVSTDGLSDGSVMQGDSFDLVVTLTGGIDVPPQMVEFNNISPYNSGFSHTGPCSVSSQQPTCIITIDVATTVPAGNYAAYIGNDDTVEIGVGSAPFSVVEF